MFNPFQLLRSDLLIFSVRCFLPPFYDRTVRICSRRKGAEIQNPKGDVSCPSVVVFVFYLAVCAFARFVLKQLLERSSQHDQSPRDACDEALANELRSVYPLADERVAQPILPRSKHPWRIQ